MSICIPTCPKADITNNLPPKEYELYYHLKKDNINENLYELVNNSYKLIGKYTGFCLRPTYKSRGKIGLKINNDNIFIACKAFYNPKIGWVITENLKN